MTKLIIFAAIAGFSMLVGSIAATKFNLSNKIFSRITAFGVGSLICAITFGLLDEATISAGTWPTLIGFILGGAVFYLGDYYIIKSGGRNHKNRKLSENINVNDIDGKAILFGSILDMIPEMMALGIAIYNGRNFGFLMLVAIFSSNIPEAVSSVPGLQKNGFSKKDINVTWGVVAIISVLVSLSSYFLLHDLNITFLGVVEAFAAGAILVMISDTMMPEAYNEGGFSVGAFTLIGFLISYAILII